ncbi:MAG: hypothetical protein HY018_09795 [Hydrogenophilales bacterium]|nr:hypothetical protein [Hydrogenophilales bacterium]
MCRLRYTDEHMEQPCFPKIDAKALDRVMESDLRNLLPVWLAVLAHIAPAYADYADYSFDMKCDAIHNQAEIVPYGVSDEEVYDAAPKDCKLKSGRMIRAKMGLGPVYPYGMGGADPDKWLSVWVDYARVLSHVSLDCDVDGPCDLRVIVTSKGLNVCRRDSVSIPTNPEFLIAPKDHCAFTPNSKLVKQRDSLEFPRPGDPVRPPAGSLAVLYAKDKNLCKQFEILGEPKGRPGDNIWPKIGLPANAEPIESNAFGEEQYTFDINNDGKTESVIALHSRSHMQDGDSYFVFEDGKFPLADADQASQLPIEKAAVRIPDYWADAKHDGNNQPGKGRDPTYTVRSVGAPWWDTGDLPVFVLRYWYLWPFRYRQSTYFLTWSQEADKQHWYTVVRTEPDYSVTEMCVFQIVQVRY